MLRDVQAQSDRSQRRDNALQRRQEIESEVQLDTGGPGPVRKG